MVFEIFKKIFKRGEELDLNLNLEQPTIQNPESTLQTFQQNPPTSMPQETTFQQSFLSPQAFMPQQPPNELENIKQQIILLNSKLDMINSKLDMLLQRIQMIEQFLYYRR